MKHLGFVRFCFYGNGHDQRVTGHIYLRWVAEIHKWRISEWVRSAHNYNHCEGDVPKEGGDKFVSIVRQFVTEWGVAQQKAIDDHRKWSALRGPKDMMRRPGFRPVTAAKMWATFVNDTGAEAAKIEQDVYTALGMIAAGGWTTPDPPVIFPTLLYGNPWKL